MYSAKTTPAGADLYFNGALVGRIVWRWKGHFELDAEAQKNVGRPFVASSIGQLVSNINRRMKERA